jgi:hypothetical protein
VIGGFEHIHHYGLNDTFSGPMKTAGRSETCLHKSSHCSDSIGSMATLTGSRAIAARAVSMIAAHGRGVGRPISYADVQMAAIAQVRGARPGSRRVMLQTSRTVVLISLSLDWSVNLRPIVDRRQTISIN